jgi:transcriptional regulator with XRE-family HTH domain
MPMDPEQLILRRRAKRMTQQQVAEAAGMKQQEYARLESGKRLNPRLETIESVAHALQCRVDDLLIKVKKKRGLK